MKVAYLFLRNRCSTKFVYTNFVPNTVYSLAGYQLSYASMRLLTLKPQNVSLIADAILKHGIIFRCRRTTVCFYTESFFAEVSLRCIIYLFGEFNKRA